MKLGLSKTALLFLLPGVLGGQNGNSPTASEPAAAPAPAVDATGQFCSVEYQGNPNSGKFNDIVGCPSGYVCSDLDDEGNGEDGPFVGVCASEVCDGKADPDDSSSDTEATIRVTICHRTCSETNPWVRITIDNDAWGSLEDDGNGASGCGHQLQHDVRDECSNKSPWLPWAPQYKDYLIKVHGTREDLRAEMGWSGPNDPDEKAYWRIWERACPFVRNGQCCDWGSGECCGDYYNTPGLELPNPAIEVKKTVHLGTQATCFNGKEIQYGFDGTPITWCYEVINTGDDDLTGVTITDPDTGYSETIGDLPVGSSTFGPPLTDTITATTGGDATAVGTPSSGGSDVEDTDPAEVVLLPAYTPCPDA